MLLSDPLCGIGRHEEDALPVRAIDHTTIFHHNVDVCGRTNVLNWTLITSLGSADGIHLVAFEASIEATSWSAGQL